jgi:hypothetical protein
VRLLEAEAADLKFKLQAAEGAVLAERRRTAEAEGAAAAAERRASAACDEAAAAWGEAREAAARREATGGELAAAQGEQGRLQALVAGAPKRRHGTI